MATRIELMKRLNTALETNWNWGRLTLLDLRRLVNAVEKKK